MNKRIVIVDIDGTIADCTERAKKYLGENPDWQSFYDACDTDKPILTICNLVYILSKHFDILFVTGRKKFTEAKTTAFIEKFVFIYGEFFRVLYRSDNDNRHDTLVKPELLDKYLKENHYKKNDVEFILEDRNSMVAKWRELGFTCLQVADGNF